MNVREQVSEMTRKLPADVSIEEIVRRLYLMQKVEKGLAQADNSETISQEDAKKEWKNGSGSLDQAKIG
ncbi:MAG: hypothetical protein HQL74_00335 [Magnetococcales bacterium]|nr:hypothetical protein [Magnetococcales bacterium]